jgi:energy-coupling factor transport system ATP-binding protein
MIEFSHFSFTYTGQVKPALNAVTLSIAYGEFVLVTGPSGGGKSTFCRCLNGLIPHFHGGTLRGDVVVDDMGITEYQPRDFATKVGMVFQDPENQLVGTDVERDIAFGLENLGLAPDVIEQRVDESLAALGLTGLRRRPVAELSGGEKQKVALASALAVHPWLLVLDEPTSELDPESAREFMQTLVRLQLAIGFTVVLVEHRLERVVEYCSRIIVLDEGNVVEDGATADVLESLARDSHRIGVPPLVALSHALRGSGMWRGDPPVSVAEAQESFGDLVPEDVPEHRWEVVRPHGETLIEIDDLWYRYDVSGYALRGVSMQIRAGELLAVMGRNGSGKTTLVRHLNGLLRPERGSVRVRGTDTGGATVPQLARQVGLVFQNPNDHLFADTVEEEISFSLRHLGVEQEEWAVRFEEVLALFHLEEHRQRYPRDLSGGERQRVAVASVVSARPEVLVLDEPTRGLDHGLKEELMQFLLEYSAEGRAVVLVTHDVETVARYADRVVILDAGRVVADGPKRAVLAASEVFRPEVTRFILPYHPGEAAQAFMNVDDLLEAFI